MNLQDQNRRQRTLDFCETAELGFYSESLSRQIRGIPLKSNEFIRRIGGYTPRGCSEAAEE